MTSLISPTLPAPHDDRGFGGLIALVEGVEHPLPLREVTVRGHITGGFARTVIEQHFAAPEGTAALEAVHIFPLPPDGAVTEVELIAGDVVVRAECHERKAAEQVFEKARESGHRAALLTAERADVHTLRVTNLPPGEAIQVRIVVIEALDNVDGRFQWRFPTVVAPRFMPGNPTGHAGPGVAPDTTHVPDASRISPPLRLKGGTTLDLEVRVEGPVSEVASSLHALTVGFGEGGVRVSPSGDASLDRDFVLAFSTGDAEQVAARAWTDGKATAVLVEPPTLRIPEALPRDAVFIVDVSGSMGGQKIEAARRALVAALHGLMPGDRFQLIAFSSGMTAFRAGWTELTDQTLAAGDRWIASLRASGGTVMLPPIQAALDGATPPGRLRTVLFITDGQAGNEAELVAAVHNRRAEGRFFTLGIDTAVNASLLKRLARVGGGVAELATPDDNIESIVARLEARFGSPMALNVTAPGALEASDLFAGRPALLWVDGAPESVELTGEGFAATVTPKATQMPLAALLARHQIAMLEDQIALQPWTEEATRPRIIELALAHTLASRFTAFVAVERSSAWEGDRVAVTQPAELPHQWQAMSAGAPPPPMAMRAAAAPSRKRRKMAMRPSAPPPEMLDESSLDMMMDLEMGGAPPAPSPASNARSGIGALFGKVAEAFSGRSESVEAEEAEESVAPTGDPASRLARTQSADGSFGQDVARTAAALLALVLLGHTRRAGVRRRTVLKAARWLEGHREDPLAALALEALAEAERGATPARVEGWARLLSAGAEGHALSQAVDA
ncbi:MAG: VWA domain-containing protein [Proteobacteria bacterium]|nr:VWA domain-containing protein [Pseudomonadota bacterium]